MSHYQNFEQPFEIPASWEWVTIKDIGEIVTGNTPSKEVNEFYGGDVPFYKPTDLSQGIDTQSASDTLTQRGFEQSRQLPVNSILITCIGATIGKIGLIKKAGSCNQQINAIIPNNSVVPEYIFYVCSSSYFQNCIKENASSTTLPILNKKSFSSLLFPLPPISEQRAIIASIKDYLEILSNVEIYKIKIKSAILACKSKILELAMQGKLVPQDPTDEPAAEMLNRINPNTKIITDNPHSWNIPQTWSICRLGDIVRISSAKRVMKSDWHSQGVPFYRTREIVKLSDYGTVDNELFISHEQYEEFKKQYGIPKRGDIMLTAVGTIGKTYIVKSNDKFYYKDASVLCLSPTSLISSEFLEMLFKDENLIKQMKGNSKGTTVDTITIEKAFNYLIVLPPLKEQMRIVAKIEELYSCLDNIEASLQS